MTSRGTIYINLTAQAAMLGLIIDRADPDLDLPQEARGPYILRCAETGYDAHLGGVSLELLCEQLAEIEGEERSQ